MIVHEIKHNNMQGSVDYLFRKAQNDPVKTGRHYKHALQYTKDEFLLSLNQLISMREDKTKRSSKMNNQIKHLVIGCHPDDRSKFESQRDELLKELFNALNIEPENHLLNVFIHNDTKQPHMHVLFSRIGEDLTIFNEGNLRWRMMEFSESISKKYGFTYESKKPQITFTEKDFYRPTERTSLLKLIDYAIKDAHSQDRFFNILKEHGVYHRISNDKIIYLTPNPNVVPEDQMGSLIQDAKARTESRDDLVKELKKFGIRIKWDDNGKETTTLERYKGWSENNLPKAAKLKYLQTAIENSRLDPTLQQARKQIIEGIENCKTIGDISKLLPDAKMRYKIVKNRVEDISFEFDDHFIRLHEAFVGNVETGIYEASKPMDIPIIFQPSFYDQLNNDFEEELQKRRAKKYGGRSKMIGPINKGMSR